MYERTYNNRVLKTNEEPTTKKKRGGISWKRVVLGASLVLLGALVVWMLRTPRFQVQRVQVQGVSVVDPSDVSQYTQNLLEGNYLWVFPRTSIFLVSPETLSSAIKERFSRFSSVAIDRDGMSALRVQVKEYPGVYLWCDTDCAFMDEEGTVFADAPYFSGSAYVKIYKGAREQYPFQPLTKEDLALIKTLKDSLPGIEIVPLSMHFESSHKLVIVFTHGTHQAEIYFDPSEPVQEALQTLYSGLKSEVVASQYHNANKVLRYLDVRFANKLIYKFE